MNKLTKLFFAEFVSAVFNPAVLLFFVPFMIVFHQTESVAYALKWQIFTFVFLFVGITFLLFGLHKKIFSDLDISKREERRDFYKISLILSISYLISSIIFKGPVFYISVAAGGIVVGTYILFLINNYIKASVHLAVTSAFVITVGILYGINVSLATFWIVPLTAWSRYFLKKHKPLEMLIGVAVGTFITFGTLLFSKIFL
ncbi:MAG: hypothetical protein V1697_00920 [Candidatus Levyibacteriota bacterium]